MLIPTDDFPLNLIENKIFGKLWISQYVVSTYRFYIHLVLKNKWSINQLINCIAL